MKVTSKTVRSHLKGEARLFITTTAEAGRSQQAVDPVGHPPAEYEVSLNDPTGSTVNVNFSLYRGAMVSAKDPNTFLLFFQAIFSSFTS